MILRGVKSIEYRTRHTHIIGETFCIHAARKAGVPDVPTGVLVGTTTTSHGSNGGPIVGDISLDSLRRGLTTLD